MKKMWIAAAGVAVVLSFVLSDGLWQYYSRSRAIRQARLELRETEAAVLAARDRQNRLQSDPTAYETLVRQELGYLRPGEKEVRFLKK